MHLYLEDDPVASSFDSLYSLHFSQFHGHWRGVSVHFSSCFKIQVTFYSNYLVTFQASRSL